MACFPHRFQFREQSRKKNKKARKLGALFFFFFFIERALVRFFGKLKDAAMQFDPHPHPPTSSFSRTPI